MKFTQTKKVKIDVVSVLVSVPVRYDEEDIPNDFPFRKGDVWEAEILLSGKIVGWPKGRTGSMHMKVCDEGVYTLLDKDGNEVSKIEGDYVPNDLIPGEYGDYIELEIAEDGTITNWPKNPSLDEFNKRAGD